MTKPPREWWISVSAPNYTPASPAPMDSSWIRVVDHAAYQALSDRHDLYRVALKNIRLALEHKKEKEAFGLISEILSYLDNV